jgi:hypothetical protein
MVPLGARRMDVRTIVTAIRWAEGHQTLFVVGIKQGELKTYKRGGKKDSIALELYLVGCRNLRPAVATTSQPGSHPRGDVSGLVEGIQPLAKRADAARSSLSSGMSMSSRYKYW